MDFVEIDGATVPRESVWEDIQGDAYEIWKCLGSDDVNRIPCRPSSYEFSSAFERGDANHEQSRKNLVEVWKLTLEWIDRSGCELSGSRVIKIPHCKTTSMKPGKDSPYALDRLGRNNEVGDALIRLLEMQHEPFVLAINGKWGCGKTTFLDMWEHHLKNEKFRCVRFNAWENDFSEDPFVSFLCEIQQQLGNSFRQNLERNVSQMTRIGLGVLLKVLSAGSLSKDDFSTEVFADGKEIQSKEMFDAYKARKEMIAGFKKALSQAVKETSNAKPLIFIIDELDRCRPTYSIELLERIKHLFDIREIIFVLSVDKTQLGKSIQAIYGDIDSEGYLRRFIDLTYNLPEPSPEAFVRGVLDATHLEQYFAKHPRIKDEGAAEWIVATLAYLAPVFRFGLRDLEHIVRQVSFVTRMTAPSERLYPYLLVPLACLRFYDDELCRKFIRGDLGIKGLLNELPSFPGAKIGVGGRYVHDLVMAAFYILDRSNERGLQGPVDIAAVMGGSDLLSAGENDALSILLNYTGRKYRSLEDKAELIDAVYRKLEVASGIS